MRTSSDFWHRGLSLAVWLTWMILAAVDGGALATLRVGLFFAVPTACIWFPEPVGNLVGLNLSRGGILDRESPPPLLRWIGWFILILLPLIIWLLTRDPDPASA